MEEAEEAEEREAGGLGDKEGRCWARKGLEESGGSSGADCVSWRSRLGPGVERERVNGLGLGICGEERGGSVGVADDGGPVSGAVEGRGGGGGAYLVDEERRGVLSFCLTGSGLAANVLHKYEYLQKSINRSPCTNTSELSTGAPDCAWQISLSTAKNCPPVNTSFGPNSGQKRFRICNTVRHVHPNAHEYAPGQS